MSVGDQSKYCVKQLQGHAGFVEPELFPYGDCASIGDYRLGYEYGNITLSGSSPSVIIWSWAHSAFLHGILGACLTILARFRQMGFMVDLALNGDLKLQGRKSVFV